MLGTKRIVWLFVVVLGIGLTVVHLRTMHIQTVYELSKLHQEEQRLRQVIWKQQLRLSGALESPQALKRRVKELQLDILPPEMTVEQEDEVDVPQ